MKKLTAASKEDIEAFAQIIPYKIERDGIMSHAFFFSDLYRMVWDDIAEESRELDEDELIQIKEDLCKANKKDKKGINAFFELISDYHSFDVTEDDNDYGGIFRKMKPKVILDCCEAVMGTSGLQASFDWMEDYLRVNTSESHVWLKVLRTCALESIGVEDGKDLFTLIVSFDRKFIKLCDKFEYMMDDPLPLLKKVSNSNVLNGYFRHERWRELKKNYESVWNDEYDDEDEDW